MVYNLVFIWVLNIGKVFLLLGFWLIENMIEFLKLVEIYYDSLLLEFFIFFF